jgi:hypothetical protein
VQLTSRLTLLSACFFTLLIAKEIFSLVLAIPDAEMEDHLYLGT